MDASKDVADPSMPRSMATSLVGGSVNARKNRVIHFVKAEARPAPGDTLCIVQQIWSCILWAFLYERAHEPGDPFRQGGGAARAG